MYSDSCQGLGTGGNGEILWVKGHTFLVKVNFCPSSVQHG